MDQNLKYFFKKFCFRSSFIETLRKPLQLYRWINSDYQEYTPQFVKEKVFKNYCIANSDWVETGTFLGSSTQYFSKRSPHVYSIEPEIKLYEAACNRFKGRNVTLFNDISENVLPILLPTLSGNLNFWLDGHYSGGGTFKGNKDCPIKDELNAIAVNFDNFKKLSILIDDVRCFLSSSSEYSHYPSIDYLVDFARRFNMRWRVECDIFIMQKN
jgi:hypothetical protein